MQEEDVVESLEASRRRLQAALQPAEGLLAAIAGVVLCFAGRYFPYSAFFWRAFMLKGWPPISNAVAQLRRRYETKAGASSTAPERSSGFLQVKQSMQSMLSRLQTLTQANRDVPELRQELLGLQTDLAQVAPMALAEVSSVNELLAELRQVYKECLAEATLEASSYMGLNFNVGDSVATGLNRFSAPRLRVLLENALQRAGIQLQILREDPLACRLLEALIRAASNSMGIAASYFVEARLCALSNARLGAKIAVNGLTRWMIRNGHWQQDGTGSSKAAGPGRAHPVLGRSLLAVPAGGRRHVSVLLPLGKLGRQQNRHAVVRSALVAGVLDPGLHCCQSCWLDGCLVVGDHSRSVATRSSGRDLRSAMLNQFDTSHQGSKLCNLATSTYSEFVH